MNGKRAKGIRKLIYGTEGATYNPYTYVLDDKKIVCVGKRRLYQKLKRELRTRAKYLGLPPAKLKRVA